MSVAPDELHPDLRGEQEHLDLAYRCLGEMERRAAFAVADAAERAPGDWDATVAHRLLSARLETMRSDLGPLCFGRIDDLADSWHIGRRHVEDGEGEPVVVDWRATVAVPFYRATYRDPLGLVRRRRFLVDGQLLADLVDERFDDPDESSVVGATGLPDPLLAELGRARTGTMRDIVATIAAEQDQVIRAPLTATLVVQGGPGTGKTAVGLHRAAWLLYEHRQELERDGVLVLGPNPVFLSYISEVLPSLGEVAVTQTTLAGLASAWRATGTEAADVAEIKGSGVLAEVIRRALEGACRPPEPGEPHRVRTRWGTCDIAAEEIAVVLQQALASGGTMTHRRGRFVQGVHRIVQMKASDRMGELLDRESVQREIGGDRTLQAILAKAFPSESPGGVLRRLYGSPAALAAAADGLLAPRERALLGRRPARSVAGEPWTSADLPLLDEARTLITGVPRRYGHIVVDEAQDLSHMALRMVARRSADGRSFTILGDLAQATEPGATRSWAASLGALGPPGEGEIEVLTTGYRVPAPIMEVANGLLAEVAPDLAPTVSVRPSELSPIVHLADVGPGEDPPDAAARTAAAAAEQLLGEYVSVAVIAPEDYLKAVRTALSDRGIGIVPSQHASAAGCVAVITPDLAKGLEFDAVVVVEPGTVLAGPGGGGLLYIALTRAVQMLVLVTAYDLPPALERALIGA